VFSPVLADVANHLRIEVMRSSLRQLRNPALAMDRQMSVSLAAMMSLGVEMAPALRKPFRNVSISMRCLQSRSQRL
jgi:hypothetical protein